MQSVPKNPLIATFQLSSAASLNLGWSQIGVLGKGLTETEIIILATFVVCKSFEFGPVQKLLFGKELTLSQTSPGFYVSAENSVVKGEIARYEQFLLFPQCFLPF